MPLGPGARLGPYEVVAAIGAGGMGEVYRARDTKLSRDVALKILPPTFASDPDRLARFHREAQVLASLNHPHIGAIYGFEDSGETHALVLEFVDGPTLADRIAQGRIPIDEALPIAIQIAEALSAAHEQGIIHRDLKPANIKLRADGTVKVLDFGLAKLNDANVPNASNTSNALSLSPTITSPALMTGAGMMLGTVGYAAPEQARGRPVDRRADIWAFGCVLYEMLTGVRAFEGQDFAEVLASLLKTEPDVTKLPSRTPLAIRQLLRRCLQKDPARRFRDAGDIAIECREAAAALAAGTSPGEAAVYGRTRLLVIAAAALVAGALVASTAVWQLRPAPVSEVSRFRIMLAPGQRLAALDQTAIAFSPDGRHFAYVATTGGLPQLYLGSFDSVDAMPMANTEGGQAPFFSPDGKWLGFFTNDALKKVPVAGGSAVRLAQADNYGRGADWGPDGRIVYAPRYDDGLWMVQDTGAMARRITMLDRAKREGSHRFPHLLPDGASVLLTVGTGSSWDDASIEVLKLDSGERKPLIQGGSDARYVPTGHLVYQRAGALVGVPFDLKTLTVTGGSTTIVQTVLPSTNNTGSAQVAISGTGSLMYVSGTGSLDRRLVWVDRTGAEDRLPLPVRAYRHPRISPDGQRVVLDIDEGNKSDLWIYDLSRGTLERSTFDGQAQFGSWSADGRKVVFLASNGAIPALFWKDANRSAAAEKLLDADRPERGGSWSKDGSLLTFTIQDAMSGWDVWTRSLNGGRTPHRFTSTPFNETNPEFSPDGKWIAYQSDESGKDEVYVQPFSTDGSRILVSTDGGMEPLWSADGRELFYRNGDHIMTAAVTTQSTFRVGKPTRLFDKRTWTLATDRNFDVTSDGRRFLMIVESEQVAAANHFNIVLNWFDELKRLVPAK